MHQLFRDGLNFIKDEDTFLRQYLGDKVLARIDEHGVACLGWSSHLKLAFRALVTFWAKSVPEADHVIRADVCTALHPLSPQPGQLLLYFGMQSSSPGVRGQYVCVNFNQTNEFESFNLFIGGSVDKSILYSLWNDEDADGNLNGFQFSTKDQLEAASHKHAIVMARQRQKIIHKLPYKVGGLCPIACQKGWDVTCPTEDQAAEIFFKYWRERELKLDAAGRATERAKMLANNRERCGISIRLIMSGCSVADAYDLGLSSSI